MSVSYVRLSTIGGNGIKMLFISLLTILATGGISLLAAQFRIWRTALRTGTTAPACRQLLVLGKQLQQGECTDEFRVRLLRALRLLESGSGETIYILGGVTSAEAPSEAAAGRDYLLAQGCEPQRLFLEERSRHTLENLQQIRDLPGLDAEFTLITSRYHLARSDAMARGMGLTPQLCAAEPAIHLTPATLARLITEGFLLHWYYTGKYWAHMVNDRQSIDRIS